MSNQSDPKWPFKHISKKSGWPMQPLVVQFAGAVLQAPPEQRKELAHKMVERCVRMGARLAVEFGVSPTKFMKVAEAMMVKEGGEKAAQTLKLAKAEQTTAANEKAGEMVADILKNAAWNGQTGEA